MDDVELRSVTADEWEPFQKAFALPFGEAVSQTDSLIWRDIIEFDRTLAGVDRDRFVATSAALSMHLSVPGGNLAMAGVTGVAVLPTHRRQGLLRRMMQRLLDQARERGEPLAGLWASESVIYGRYGFGWAASQARFEVQTRHADFARPVDTQGLARIVEPGEAAATFPEIYERVRARVPGMPARPAPFWAWLHHDPDEWRGGAGPRNHALVEGRGYVTYRIKEHWPPEGWAANELRVEELVAADDEALALLWRWCLDHDLVATVVARGRPVDDPLPHLLADPRRAGARLTDSLWLCVLDVPAALGGRRYQTDGSLTFTISDAFVPGVAGTWRLEARDGEGRCEPTEDPPDLTLHASDLSAVYLGGTTPSRLQRAGRVREHRAGTAQHADALLGWTPAPWCPIEF